MNRPCKTSWPSQLERTNHRGQQTKWGSTCAFSRLLNRKCRLGSPLSSLIHSKCSLGMISVAEAQHRRHFGAYFPGKNQPSRWLSHSSGASSFNRCACGLRQSNTLCRSYIAKSTSASKSSAKRCGRDPSFGASVPGHFRFWGATTAAMCHLYTYL